MKDKILFVTKGSEQCDEGSSYALELAKTLHAGIEILIMNASHPATQFEDVMAAAAFAEEGDLKSTKEVLESDQIACRKKVEEKINNRPLKCLGYLTPIEFENKMNSLAGAHI